MYPLFKRVGAPLLITPASFFSIAMCHSRTPQAIRGATRPDKPCANSVGLALSSHWCIIPHPDKVDKGGEDACYATTESAGVADGVGGWGSSTIDAGMYSKALIQATKSISETAAIGFVPSKQRASLPVARLWDAYKSVQKQKIVGSTTVTLISLDEGDSVLHTLNLGDSGFLVLRSDKSGQWDIVAQSAEQQHYFNCPFQLGTGCDDTPDHANCEELQVQPGDLVVLATDGVFDNIFTHKIVEIVSQAEDVDDTATAIATEAFRMASSLTGLTPFAIKANAVGYTFDGGKLDDITVLVARIVDFEAE
eukprot:TRINITY_DN19853_c0_g1_i1.p1 TRINITY_DN19853_c0_g1~~TRINITY_DN19853_c0_g1_i1.p1  ORF type:complete len:308 (+),score=66.35 TRINITY_DN19853_c0_g1_i1:285-1208(+)